MLYASRIFKSDITEVNKNRRKSKTMKFPPPISPEEAVNNIVYNTPASPSGPPTRHIINCLVRNDSGVLARVSGVLASRDFNIDSVIGAKTEIPNLSRMTIVLREPREVVKKVVTQLEDLVPVWAVLDYQNIKTLERELLMVKVSTLGPKAELLDSVSKSHIQALYHSGNILLTLTELTRLFDGRILDVCPESVIIELSAKSERIDAFINLLHPYGILEAARSGAMAMPRSDMTLYSLASEEKHSEENEVDVSKLPPG